jgi:histone H3/H4
MAQQRKTTIIPKASAARILIKAGAKRVSAPAAEEFSQLLQSIGEEISGHAVKIAKHSGRKTVHAGDIRVAVK